MLLYTGIYNPNSLPVKHYRFRLDFNFWRIITLAHIRMSLQYAERQQQHRDRQSQGQLSHRAPAGTPPAPLMLRASKQRGTSQTTAVSAGEFRSLARGSSWGSDWLRGSDTGPRGAAPLQTPRQELIAMGPQGFLGAAHPFQPAKPSCSRAGPSQPD